MQTHRHGCVTAVRAVGLRFGRSGPFDVIPSSIASHFTAAVRNRGRTYLQERRVHVLEQDQGRVVAHVRGSAYYDVTLRLDRESGGLRGACTCPQARDGVACKHLWGTLLEADRTGFATRARAFAVDPAAATASHDATSALRSRLGALRRPAWHELLEGVDAARTPAPRAAQQLWYVVSPLPGGTTLGVNIVVRDRKANGDWGRARPGSFLSPTEPPDTTIVGVLRGAAHYHPGAGSPSQYQLTSDVWQVLLPLMCRTGRCTLETADGQLGQPLAWDDGPPWSLALEAPLSPDGSHLLLSAVLTRGEERRPLQSVEFLLAGGLVVWPGAVSTFDDHGAFRWAAILTEHAPLPVPVSDLGRLIVELTRGPGRVPIALPESLAVSSMLGTPRPVLRVGAPAQVAAGAHPVHEYLPARVAFIYGDATVDASSLGHATWSSVDRAILERDREAEQRAVSSLHAAGVRPSRDGSDGSRVEVRARELPRVVRDLTAAGWQVEAEGRLYRRGKMASMAVRSGIDWFELHGRFDFDGLELDVEEVWQAVARGETTVTLGDGSIGLLPEEWLGRHGLVAAIGETADGHVRFARSQAALLDAWLSELPPVDGDDAFRHARAALRDPQAGQPRDAADSFVGTLRGYQREGLGWLDFLERIGCGGCLADDMGLGKTVQVLAHLDARCRRGARRGASLVVVPRSLVFNWMDEAARFTPRLRVLDHTGVARERDAAAFAELDIVLVTYGTLRRDIAWLKDIEFDYVVLDEAHAIKNASSESARVARLLRARHRLALSGTPVQNHLGELWSLFEFLNPGMFGASQAFGRVAGRRGADDETRELLLRAVRPFVLRRTKEAVAPELPPKVEQVVHCVMGAPQRKVYDKLLSRVRASVEHRIAEAGWARARMHVLEALLRLRQAACHPGLVGAEHAQSGSAKLDVLFERLDEILDEGHRALVFSQFTSLLAHVREHLDARGLRYAYLDGRTRDREARVKAFQEDDGIGIFLISLKAGGLGLNLTAADYVFLLDPWWNPAIEAQAIDRAHRIGQTRPVVAYRLIARDTVEEKILQLQAQKRDLSATVVPSDEGLVKRLTEADLAFLFG